MEEGSVGGCEAWWRESEAATLGFASTLGSSPRAPRRPTEDVAQVHTQAVESARTTALTALCY